MRRWLPILLIIALMTAGTLPAAEKELKVGFVYVSPIGDAGWSYAHDLGRQHIAALPGVQTAYVEAAEVVGCSGTRVVFRHILPNLTSPLLTLAILEFARIVLAEAALSFLGMGIQPPATSWGLDVASGKNYLFRAWWLVTFPGIAISLTVLAINLVASWMRLVSDPQEREKQFARQMRARRKRGPVVQEVV